MQNNPKVVEKFRTASLKGWDYALKHPDEAIAVIQSKYHSKKTTEQLQFEANAIKKVIQPDLVDIGTMDRARWAQITHHLMAVGQISPKFHLAEDFLYTPPQDIQWQRLLPGIVSTLAAFILLLIFVSIISKSNFRLRVTRKQLRGEIEERKLAEDALRGSERKFRQLADHTHDWEYWIKPDGKYLYLSPACERITGYQPEEFMSRPELLFDIVAPKHVESVHQHYLDENNKETPVFSLVFSIVTKSGEERWIEHNCSPIFDEQGDYIGRRGN
ncbi:MAG: PAS domain-containing protein, partial [Desulfocapsa sp.]|nr:PAS domain-containing protein [Desulfocapsa sp.]